MQIVIGVLLLIMAVFLVVAVLLQSSKSHRLSGTIAGGAETFFGKQKGKSIDALLSKLTTIVAIVFVILVLVLYIMSAQDGTTNNVVDDGDIVVEDGAEVEVEGEVEAETEVETEVEPEAETETETETEVEPEAETETEAEAEPQAETETAEA